jgi:hypothetical protein
MMIWTRKVKDLLCLIGYAFFTTSRQVITTTTSTIDVMIAANAFSAEARKTYD